MNALKTSWLLYLLSPLVLTAQISISGTLTEAGSNKPVPYATIYINGTTKGTITNTSGEFKLEKVRIPTEIVISHVSYFPEIIDLRKDIDTVFHIQLNPRDVELGTVEITDINRREENLQHFKDRFLGTDYWGQHAEIINDSVLIFKRDKIESVEDSSNLFYAGYFDFKFEVNAKAPIWVHLPLLGYKLRVDLVNYEEYYGQIKSKYQFHTLGYFYFMPTENVSKRKTNRYHKKRIEAWYNSDRHFCRSLFTDSLKENGYLLIDLSAVVSEDREFNIHDNIIQSGDELKIIGLKNRGIFIEYWERFNRPYDATKVDGVERPFSPNRLTSKMYFLKDTCTIRSDGSRPDNSIMFGPKIGDKRVGAMLPYDFSPR